METKQIKIELLEPNTGQINGLPTNPRKFTTSDIDRIAKSIEETPELFESRPIIAVPLDGKYVILGGNLRFEGAKQIGMKKVPCIIFDDLITDEGTFYSLCEHHCMPFFGRYVFAYIPNPKGKILGLSKIARTVDFYAAKLQIQERLVREIVMAIQDSLGGEYPPLGIALFMEAEHLCKTMRGAKKQGKMSCSYLTGVFKEDTPARSEFLRKINK